jgi:hypothetical protein
MNKTNGSSVTTQEENSIWPETYKGVTLPG